MKSALAIIGGLVVGVIVAAGILAAFVFVGPDPVGLRPTPSPSVVPTEIAVPSASVAASASPSIAPSASFVLPAPASVVVPALASVAPSGSAGVGGSPPP